MTKTTSSRTIKSEEKRSAILDAAEVEFGTKGFAKTSLTDIAALAAVSRPLLYRHFDDKEELYEAVIERIQKQWYEILATEAARNTPSTAHTVRLILTACLEFARTHPFLNKLLSGDSRNALGKFSNVVDKGHDMMRQLILEVLQKGVRRGDVRNDLDTDDLAHVISEVFLAYGEHIIAGDNLELGARRIDAILETLFHGFVASHSG